VVFVVVVLPAPVVLAKVIKVLAVFNSSLLVLSFVSFSF